MTATLFCGAAGAALALSGCGGGGSVGSAIDPVAQAAEISELAPGFKATYYESISDPGSTTVTASGTEDVERAGQRAVFNFTAHAHGKSVSISSQYAGGALYLELPGAQQSSITHDRKWIEYNVNDVAAALGIQSSSLAGARSSSDPSKQLSYLRAAGGDVSRVGLERVQGTPTTHYRATIDWARYPERVPASQRAAARSSISVLERLTGSSSQTVDVWIDAEHRVRREEFTVQECVPGSSGKAEMHTAAEYFDFGPQAIAKLPPSREVADLTTYLAKQLKRTKLGCQ